MSELPGADPGQDGLWLRPDGWEPVFPGQPTHLRGDQAPWVRWRSILNYSAPSHHEQRGGPNMAKKAASPATVTLKHLAAAIAEEQELSKKQAEGILTDVVTRIAKHLKKGDRIR